MSDNRVIANGAVATAYDLFGSELAIGREARIPACFPRQVALGWSVLRRRNGDTSSGGTAVEGRRVAPIRRGKTAVADAGSARPPGTGACRLRGVSSCLPPLGTAA